jgi:hypothetical protein
MKRIILTFATLFIIQHLYSQVMDFRNTPLRLIEDCVIKTHINIDDSISRIETIKKNDSSFISKAYRKDSSIIYSIQFKSINPEKRHGRYVSYFPNKKIHCSGQYVDNIAFGDWRYYKSNGDLDTVINFNEAIKLLMTEENKTIFVESEEDASFEGGSFSKFRSFIQQHLIYPDYVLKRRITGKVLVQFIVNDSGYIAMPKALRSVDNDLSMEIFRIFSSSPQWQPAKQAGKTVCKQFVLPIKFEIEK